MKVQNFFEEKKIDTKYSKKNSSKTGTKGLVEEDPDEKQVIKKKSHKRHVTELPGTYLQQRIHSTSLSFLNKTEIENSAN